VKKKVLIIGGAGFAGRSITSTLIKNEYDIHIISRTVSPFPPSIPLHYYQNDIQESDHLDSLVSSCPDILYFASDTTPGTSADDPQLELQKNLQPLLHLIKNIQKYENKHLIYLSSGGTVYGNSQNTSFCEEECFSPSSYYGAGKIAAEVFLKSFQIQYGNQVTILRPSNFYGVGQPYKTGFGVIRTILECMYNNETFQVWGNGQAKRDYINIQDFVSACLMLLITPPSSKFNIFNIASEHVISLLDLIKLIEKTIGKNLDIKFLPGRNCDIESIALDCSKLGALKWKSIITLETGISEMWQWICKTKKI